MFFKLLDVGVEEVEQELVVQVITDNASTFFAHILFAHSLEVNIASNGCLN